ncbi:MAG: AI-2E family transporter [Novosphingobium sp.]
MPSEPEPGADPSDSPQAPTQQTRERDRLLSAIVVLCGLLLFIGLPFALSAGAEFFLPLVAAAIISLAVSPLADWFAARRLPNWLASFLALGTLVGVLSVAVATVIQPAIALADTLPQFAQRIAARTSVFSGWLREVAQMLDTLGRNFGQSRTREVVLSSQGSIRDLLMQTPGVLLHVLLTILLAFFMIEARGRLRRNLLLERQEFTASLRAARVLRDVQAMMATYFATTVLVAIGVGIIVGTAAWAFGWQSPVMWGGLAALMNLLPYVGPLTMIVVLGLFGLAGQGSLLWSLTPALAYIALHTVESNVVTPILMGRRLAVSPVAILASLIYFGWIWGIVGIFLAGPLLVIIMAFLEHTGTPNVIGFVFGEPLFAPAAPDLREGEGGDQPG